MSDETNEIIPDPMWLNNEIIAAMIETAPPEWNGVEFVIEKTARDEESGLTTRLSSPDGRSAEASEALVEAAKALVEGLPPHMNDWSSVVFRAIPLDDGSWNCEADFRRPTGTAES